MLNFPHFYLILPGLISFLIGIIFILVHKPDSWYKMHTLFNIIGMILSLAGILALMGLTWIPHAYIGLVTGVILAVIVIIGIFTRISNKNKKNMRKFHIWGGRISFILLIVGLILGLRYFV